MSTNDAFDIGFSAYLNGQSIHNNPYTDKTLRKEWLSGWRAARRWDTKGTF